MYFAPYFQVRSCWVELSAQDSECSLDFCVDQQTDVTEEKNLLELTGRSLTLVASRFAVQQMDDN